MTEKTVTHKVSMSSKTYYILLLLIAAFSLWIRSGFPVYAIPSAMHDDALFVKLARTLEAGHWLGFYNNLTLAKGMFYPLFIDIAFWTSVPLKIAEQIVYLAAAWLTAEIIRRRLGARFPSLLLFGLLAFNPVVWNWSFARVLRQCVYMSLSLAFVALVLAIAFPIFDEQGRGSRRLLLKGAALGLVSAAYWMTREEGIWIFPALAVIIAVAFIGVWRPNWLPVSERGTFPRRSTHLKTIVLPLALALAVFTAADWLVAGINYRHYGLFETNEFRSKSFLHAYAAIQRIKHDHWLPFITFPKDARQRAYAVSPAARELKSAYEGDIGKGWAWVTCTQMRRPGPCDEVEAPWAMWAFRDAVAAAGHYHSGREAMRYYDTLAHQIDSACDRGVIQCDSPGVNGLPPFRWQYVGESVQASKPIARMMFRMLEGQIAPLPSTPPDDGLSTFTDTVDGVPPSKVDTAVWGWAAAASATPTLRLAATDASEKFNSSIDLFPAPDVLAAYPTLKSERFELKTDCPVSACDLVLNVAGKDETRVPLSELLKSLGHAPVVNGPALKLNIELVPGFDGHKFTDSRRAAQVKIANVMASTYANVFPVLAIFCGVGLVMAAFFRKRCPMPTSILALGAGSAAAVASLIAMLSYLNAALEFAVANVLYTSAASPFVITFTFVGMYAWFAALRLAVSPVISSATVHRILGRVNVKQVSAPR